MRRFAAAVALVALAATAHAARVQVDLPTYAALKVVDRSSSGPRIDCPPTCVYEVPGPQHGIFDLFVEPEPDPRIGDRPWDIVEMVGCRGTSALPADNGVCYLPPGDVTIGFRLQYRPIVAVTYGGSYGGPLSFLSITVNPAPGYQGSGGGYPCDATKQAGSFMKCAGHFSAGQPVALSAPSTVQATLSQVSAPCGAQTCEIRVTEDTCISYLYENGLPALFPTVPTTGPTCPTGPGVTGSGGGGDPGGGGGGGPPPGLETLKDLALEQMRLEFSQSLAPCIYSATGVALFAVPAGGLAIGGVLLDIAGPLCQHYLLHIIELERVYKDPPDFDFDTIAPITPAARPPVDVSSCEQATGDERRLCRRVGKAAGKYLGKVVRVGDVAEALRITVERVTAADAAGEERAAKRQLRAAKKRGKQLEAAVAARARAGAKLASTLAEAQITGALSEPQFAEASTNVLGRLAAQGLAEDAARAALGPALTPTAQDLLVVLGRE